MVVRFRIIAPAAKQRTFAVRLPILLGRGDDAKLRIQHDLISRRHCELFERQGRVYIHDLGSTNGTFLNDEQVPVSVKTVVPPGGIVRVGGLVFAVEYAQTEATDLVAAVGDGDRRSSGGAEESRVEGSDEHEHPDFQIVHADEEARAESSERALNPGAEPGAGPAAAAGDSAADVAADAPANMEGRPPEKAAESQDSPAPSPKQPGGFDFLSLDVPSSSETPQWPVVDDVADASDDDQLDNFFKNLK